MEWCSNTVITVCSFLLVFVQLSSAEDVTIGYLTVDKSPKLKRDKQGRIISGAISYALEQINNNSQILPNYTFHLIWADTNDSTLVGTLRLTEQWRQGAIAFFGLEDSCTVEATVAAAWNLPMISYKCADYDVSDKERYPTFARTYPPATQVTKSILSLLLHFKWMRFTLVHGSSHKQQTIAKKLLELAAEHNMTLNKIKQYDEPHIPFTAGNPFPGIVEQTFVSTRVYVFLGGLNGMVDLMTNLYDRGLLDTGEYVVIHVDDGANDQKDPLKYFKRTADPPNESRNMLAARSLLIISNSVPSSPKYSDFIRAVDKYNEKPPFNFPNPFNRTKKVTVFAAYLYDAVYLYVRAAHKVVGEGKDIRNGAAIMEKIRGTSYNSVLGVMSHIDENGDAEGNYTLLVRMPYRTNISLFSMRPAGHFTIGVDLPQFTFFKNMFIDWITGDPPVDQPPCGYYGERCIPPKTYTLEIAGGVVGGIVLTAIIVGLILYRNWHYEQEIAGLLWRISIEDLRITDSQALMRKESFGSRISLGGQLSYDSRMSFTQVYARTGFYKGQVVALKKYESKNLIVTRKMKKEMKLMRDLRHQNINTFHGACIYPPAFSIVTEYCSKGSLQDILENEDYKLDAMFIGSLIKDIIQGMIFIHDSVLIYHGNLKSSNCVVSGRWSLQITDYGLLDIRAATYKIEDEHAFYRNLFWKAPELISSKYTKGSQKGDVYSFGIILHEIFGRTGPYGFCKIHPKEIIDRVKAGTIRPDTSMLTCESYVIECMKLSWSENIDDRPDLRAVWKYLQPMRREGVKKNIIDNMMAMMERYQKNLEELVEERTEQLIEEKKKTEALLLQMLPRSVAEKLKIGEPVVPEAYNSVTIYFSDICAFTKLSAESTPLQVVDLLNDLYICFDSIIKNYDVYKVETIGDAYMVVSGLPIQNGDNHAGEIASMSLHLLRTIKTFKIRHRPNDTLMLRIGIHTGPCVAGVVGLTMPRFTLFGDTVNTTSRMESNGDALKIHCSAECKALLDRLGGYTLEKRGLVPMKGKGDMLTYWLSSEDESVRSARLRKCGKRFKYNTTDVPEKGFCQILRLTKGADIQQSVKEVKDKINTHSDPSLLRLFRDNKERSLSKDAASPFNISQLPNSESFSSRSLPQKENYIFDSESKHTFHYPNGLYPGDLRQLASDPNSPSDCYGEESSGEADHLLTRHLSIGGRSPLHNTDIDMKYHIGTQNSSLPLSIRPKSISTTKI